MGSFCKLPKRVGTLLWHFDLSGMPDPASPLIRTAVYGLTDVSRRKKWGCAGGYVETGSSIVTTTPRALQNPHN